MDNNTITYVLAAPALALLAIIPAFLLAARRAKKMQKQGELAQFNTELEKKRELKIARRNAKRKAPKP